MDVIDFIILLSIILACSIVVVTISYFLMKNSVRNAITHRTRESELNNKDMVQNINDNTNILNDLKKDMKRDFASVKSDINSLNGTVKYLYDKDQTQL